jgi:hypothetical protein
MKQEPIFEQGVWFTPMILAIGGIAAAMFSLALM